MYKVYVRVNGENDIMAINSDAFMPRPVPDGWVQIDEGEGDKYHHAQNNYLEGGLWNADSTALRWRLENGVPVLKEDE